MQITFQKPWQGLVCVVAFSAIGMACAPSHNESPRAEPPEQQTPPTEKDYEILYQLQDHNELRQLDSTQRLLDQEVDYETDYSETLQPEAGFEDAEPEMFSPLPPPDVSMRGADGVFTMATIGDSISVGFNAMLPAHNRALNWNSGNNIFNLVKSHFLRLRGIFSKGVVKYNEAKVGANAEVVRQQMEKVKENLNGRELDYLTLMVGANDVCFWPKDHQDYLKRYEENVRATIESALEVNNSLRITVVPVPNMLVLEKVGRTKLCHYAWRLVNMCDPLFFAKSDEERLAFGQRLKDLNDRLAAISQDYPDHIHFAEKVATAVFDEKDVSSIDCFHPSQKGQQKLARDAWEGGWYDRQKSDVTVAQ